MKFFIIVAVLFIFAVLGYKSLPGRVVYITDLKVEQVQSLEACREDVKKLEEHIAVLEKSKESPHEEPTASTSNSSSPAVSPTKNTTVSGQTNSQAIKNQAPSARESDEEILVDTPLTPNDACMFATVKRDIKLANSLTWDLKNGGSFVGDLPAGSIVEILSTNLDLWADYPDEHGVYVRVKKSPKASRMEGQLGYMELSGIDHKRCNLGAEFER